jgi:hypothetical protein
MKKLVLILSVAGMVTFALTSCNRDHDQEAAIEQTLQVELAQNQSYTYSLPENLRKDAYEFTTQASHYSVSTLGKNSAGNQIYQYTPALDYVGTDQVVVSNDHEKNENHAPGCNQQGNPGSGQCMGGGAAGPEDHYMVTINFTIGRGDASTTK